MTTDTAAHKLTFAVLPSKQAEDSTQAMTIHYESARRTQTGTTMAAVGPGMLMRKQDMGRIQTRYGAGFLRCAVVCYALTQFSTAGL